jgi:hypothetical protein
MADSSVTRRGLMQGTAVVGVAAAVASAANAQTNATTGVEAVWLDGTPPASHEGQCWGVPWPRGAAPAKSSFKAELSDGRATPLQSWTTAWWPDGSIKWTAHAVPAGEALASGLKITTGRPAAPARPVKVVESADAITIDTGAATWVVARRGAALVRSATVGGREVMRDLALIATAQGSAPTDDGENPALTRYRAEIDKAVVEQTGPVRAVVRLEGRHQGGGRAWLPFTLRLYFHVGAQAARIVHSFIFDGDPDKDFIRGLGLTGAVPMRDMAHDRHVRFAGQDGGLWAEGVRPLTGLSRDPGKAFREAQIAGRATPPFAEMAANVRAFIERIAAWGDFRLSQTNSDGFSIIKRTKAGHGWVDVDTAGRAAGLGYVGGVSGGVAFGMKDFWQRSPVRLDINDAASDLAHFTVWHHAPDAAAMDLRFYHDGMGMNDHAAENEGLDVTYEDYEKGWGTAVGVARTTEFMLWALPATPSRERFSEMAHEVSQAPRLICPPTRLHAAGVFGMWSPVDRSTPKRRVLEDQQDKVLSFYRDEVDQRRWYGFWNYGDVMHTYDVDRHVWRYDIGGYAWQNSELSPDLWLWYAFLRSGRADVFRLAEAMTRHTSEVDVYHLGRFKGFGTRHGVQHWGDSSKQPRVSTAAFKRIYYYLTADERVGDLMRDLVDSEYTLQRVEIGRKVNARASRPGFNSGAAADKPLPAGQVYVEFGSVWGSLIASWYTEWERTGDRKWRDRIVAGMRTIADMPQGWFVGGAPFDLATGKFISEGTQVRMSVLNGVFGVFEMHAELLELIDEPKYRERWLDYCAFFNAPEAEFTAKTGQPGRGRGLRTAHSRYSAYAAVQRKDPALAKRAWSEFWEGDDEGYDGFARDTVRRIEAPNVLKPVNEMNEVRTNGVSQWSVAMFANLAMIGDALE